jgi:hypothetical protein
MIRARSLAAITCADKSFIHGTGVDVGVVADLRPRQQNGANTDDTLRF